MSYGMDFLGGVKYQSAILKDVPEVIGIFAETFGPAYSFIRKLAKTDKVKVFRVQGVWSDSHKFGATAKKKAIEIAKKLETIAKEFPLITFYYSPYCEHPLKRAAMNPVMRDINQVAPRLALVNTPTKEGDFLADYINETHGGDGRIPSKGPFFFSFDGHPCVDSDVEKIKAKFKDAYHFFFWDAPYNCRHEADDTTPRPERTHKPSATFIRSIKALYAPKGPAALPSKWLYKSHAENNGDSDKRAEKPLLIIPKKTREVVLRVGEDVVARFKYYGPYAGGGYRYYYTEKMGFQIADGLCDVWVDGKRYGSVNPAFRQNLYR